MTGDRFVMCTDGLIETRRASLDEGMSRLIVAAETCQHMPAAPAAEWLAATVSSGDDDVAVIVADVQLRPAPAGKGPGGGGERSMICRVTPCGRSPVWTDASTPAARGNVPRPLVP